MSRHILFIHGGGGEEDYTADALMVDSLKKIIGDPYVVHYPLLPTDESAPDFGRKKQIEKEISSIGDKVILIGHSLGASMLLKYLAENRDDKTITGIFLIATPFWSGDEDWKQGFILNRDFAEKLPSDIPIFFYHSKDDTEVPFDHLRIYAQHLPHATIREIEIGGHHLGNDLTLVARDVQSLEY
jgi:uncharacterized protein